MPGLLGWGFAAAAAFQVEAASLVGTVRDAATGRPLAGAIVSLPELVLAATTDRSGRYLLRPVGSGPQQIVVRSIGYASRTLGALVPDAGELEINVGLERAPIPLPPLVVRAAPVAAGPDHRAPTVFPDQEVSRLAMTRHPFLAEPDALQALGGGVVSLGLEAPSGVHVRGAAADQTGYLLDGIPVLGPYHSAGLFGGWNPDALDRVRVTSSSVLPELPDALGGVIAAVTRPAGTKLAAEGSVGTTQARLTVDGPIGRRVGFLFGFRAGYPGLIAPRGESSYLRGGSGDWLAKVEGPALGGRFKVLGFGLDDEVSAGVIGGIETNSPGRNQFEWRSQSVGAEWQRTWARTTVRWVGWSASNGADADWAARQGNLHLTSERLDRGAMALVEHRGARSFTSAAVRVNSSRTGYQVDSTAGLDARTPVATAIVSRRQDLTGRLTVEAGAAAATGAGRTRLGPHVRLQWRVAGVVTATATYDRIHQFSQSIRNPESIVSAIFPADLFVGSGAPGVPVARSDLAVVALETRLGPRARIGVQAYGRRSVGLALAAPRGGEPFSTGSFAVGRGAASGVAVDASVSTPRVGMMASYGLHQVRLEADGVSYRPNQGAAHTLDAGVVVFPTTSSSLRLGVTAAGGRRATAATGGFEWEACNLGDRGCEFSGSPFVADGTLGRTTLPGYLRVDLGVRKEWRLRTGQRGAVALFGTYSNLLGRKNLLTYAVDPLTGGRSAIEMRPPAPVVIGLDWRF